MANSDRIAERTAAGPSTQTNIGQPESRYAGAITITTLSSKTQLNACGDPEQSVRLGLA